MPTRIDHIIFVCDDLMAAERTFADLGFFVTGGGVHPHLGTRNRVIVLGEGYLELVAVADSAVASEAIKSHLARGAGFIGYAAQTDDIASAARAMRERGVDAHGPTAGRLVAPNGTARSWRTVTIGGGDLWSSANPLPFLIQHDATGAEHQRQLGGIDGLAAHPNGAHSIMGLTIATAKLSALHQRYGLALEMADNSEPQMDTSLGALTTTLTFDESKEWIMLAQPTGSGRASERLSVSGDGLFQVTIAVASTFAAAAWLARRGIATEPTSDSLSIAIPGARAAWIVLWERE